MRLKPQNLPVKIDKFDIAMIEETRKASSDWRALELRREQESAIFPDAMATLFSALWKPQPLPNPEKSKRGAALAQLLETAQQMPEWRALRQDTILDEVASAIGAIEIGANIELPEVDETDPRPQGQPLTPRELEEFRKGMKEVLVKAQGGVNEQKDAENLFWGTATGEGRQALDPEERIRFGKAIKQNKKLQDLAEMVGRLRIIAQRTQRNRVVHGREELVGIKTGDDLFSLLPQELLYLTDPVLELLFLQKFVEQNLFVYDYEGTQDLGKGPIIAMLDMSSSMGDPIRGAKHYGMSSDYVAKSVWAIGIALALCLLAKNDRRDVYITFFNGGIVKEFCFLKGNYNPDDILKIASISHHGGTAFEPPLRRSLTLMQESNFKKADLIFVTDGVAGVSPAFIQAWQAEKEERNFKMYSMLIGYHHTGVLQALSDMVVPVQEMQDGQAMLDAAFSV